MAKTPARKPTYQNNPFFVAVDGLTLLFKKALPVAILGIVLASLTLVSNTAQNVADIAGRKGAAFTSSQTTNQFPEQAVKDFFQSQTSQELIVLAIIVGLSLLVAIFVSTLISGVFDYTAAQLAKGKTVTLPQALKSVLDRFFGYLWLNILIGIKVFLWSLLLIVPGIIMALRYSLSGVSFFEKELGANAATKDSSRLVKGAWITTFSSFALFNIITFGMIQPVLQSGTLSVLYTQLNGYDAAKLDKPAAHWLSWLTLLLPMALFFLVILITVGSVIAFVSLTT